MFVSVQWLDVFVIPTPKTPEQVKNRKLEKVLDTILSYVINKAMKDKKVKLRCFEICIFIWEHFNYFTTKFHYKCKLKNRLKNIASLFTLKTD